MSVSTPSVAEVRTIISTTLADASITAIIADAALLAENCPVIEGYSVALQKAIVKWLAAHFISAQKGGQLMQKTLGDASESYAAPQTLMGLNGSVYGQQAILLDASGCLERLGKLKVKFKVL